MSNRSGMLAKVYHSAVEIERKFLVNSTMLPNLNGGRQFIQFYLSTEPEVRVRLSEAPDGSREAWLTVKGGGSLVRSEIEITLDPDQADALKDCAQGLIISKTRYLWVAPDGKTWELDRYSSPGAGNWVAEIELQQESESVELPDFIGKEITEDKSFKNKRIAAQGWPER